MTTEERIDYLESKVDFLSDNLIHTNKMLLGMVQNVPAPLPGEPLQESAFVLLPQQMRVKGNALQFISMIKRDGSGCVSIDNDQDRVKHCMDETFLLTRLSITEDTWIASGFNSYVVKKKS